MGSDSLIMLAGLGVGLYIVWKSGILSNLGSGGSGGGTTTTTPPPADTGGGTTTTPSPTPSPTPTPIPNPSPTPGSTTPPAGSDTCHTLYQGSCNVECASGATPLCQSCLIACGQGSLPPTGSLPSPVPVPVGQPNPSLCHSKYNGSCHTECSSGSASTCNSCKAACGANSAFAITKHAYRAWIANRARRAVLDAYYSQMRQPMITLA